MLPSDFDWEDVLTRQTVALERLADNFCPEKLSDNWHVFFQMQDLNGSMGYTYLIGAYGANADEAIVQALDNFPRLIDPDVERIYRVYATRVDHVTTVDGWAFRQTPQFQKR